MAKRFDLASAIGAQVSDLNIAREQISYLPIGELHADERNFYSIDNVEALAENIELCGLQQPIRVRQAEDGYTIVSGHRRYAAVSVLHEEDAGKFAEVPCIIEQENGSEALQELRLIYANSDTRRMTSHDLSVQAERVEALLYQLKQEGYDFPGKMRAHVAEACKVSETKLARLKAIKSKLIDDFSQYYANGELAEETAYTLSKLPAEHQQLIYDGIQKRGDSIRWLGAHTAEKRGKRLETIQADPCKYGEVMCDHVEAKKRHEAESSDSYGDVSNCARCCADCVSLSKCKNACPHLSEQVKARKEKERAEKAAAKEAQAAKDAPAIEINTKYWERFGEARAAAGKSVREVMAAARIYYGTEDEKRYSDQERGKGITPTTELPYGYNFTGNKAEQLVAVADLFGVSLDYLFCRTDEPTMAAHGAAATVSESDTVPQWRTGNPPKPGTYWCKFDCRGILVCQKAYWDGMMRAWFFSAKNGTKVDAKCVAWYPLPEVDDE